MACQTSAGLQRFLQSSKRAYNSFTDFQQGLQQSKLTCQISENLQQTAVVKMGVPNHYRCSVNFMVDKAGLTIIYTASTTFPVLKTGLANIYRPSIFLAARNILPGFYSPSTSFGGSQSSFVEPLQAFNLLSSSQNVLKEHPQAYNRLCSTILHKHSIGFMVVNTCIIICYRRSTGFVVVKTCLLEPLQSFNRQRGRQNLLAETPQALNTHYKTGMTILCRLSPSFVVVETGLRNIYRPSTIFVVVKAGLPSIGIPTSS